MNNKPTAEEKEAWLTGRDHIAPRVRAMMKQKQDDEMIMANYRAEYDRKNPPEPTTIGEVAEGITALIVLSLVAVFSLAVIGTIIGTVISLGGFIGTVLVLILVALVILIRK